MSIIIKIDGTMERIEPANGKIFTLAELQKAVGGYIQIVQVTIGEHSGKLMVVDEEGKLKLNPQLNEETSRISCQQIVGDVIIIDREQID